MQTYITCEALRLFKVLALSNGNYKEALEVLEQRYRNKKMIANSNMEALIKVPPVTSASSTKQIRELYERIKTKLRTLRSIGIDLNLMGVYWRQFCVLSCLLK